MAFFNSAITVLQTLVIALGAGLGIWGAINLLVDRVEHPRQIVHDAVDQHPFEPFRNLFENCVQKALPPVS